MTISTGHKPTDEQAAIISAVAAHGGSIMVEAGAGTAKTTTTQLAAPGVRVPALAMAFNKSIAEELKPRLPDNFTVQTFNGYGFQALRAGLPGVIKWDLQVKGKLGKLISQLAKERKLDLSTDQWDSARGLATQAQQAGLVPDSHSGGGRGLVPDSAEVWLALAEDLYIPEDEQEQIIELARAALEENNRLTMQGVISFDDQIYASACLWGKFRQYPFMCVDEAQDLNPLNHYMIELGQRPDGRLLVVGDPRQAIYGFRGADHESMGKLRRLRPAWLDRELSLTFRCPKSIVERQRGHYPNYRAAESNPEGAIHALRGGEAAEAAEWDGWGWADLVRLAQATGKRQPSIAVLCRNNAPLLSLAFKLIRQGVGVNMLGRDIGKGLIALSRKIVPKDETPADATAGAVNDWMDRERALASANGQEERVAGITDRGECLLAALSNSGVANAGDLRKVLERLFAADGGQITLGSGHRAKGLEWDCVLHLDPFRIPSKWARRAAQAGDKRQLQQEWNLKYVIETRTKHTLIEANLEDFQ